MSAEATPIPPHLAAEFFLWLWWVSEQQGGQVSLPDPVGGITLFVDDRLAFRRPEDQKVSAVLTGENASTTLEARAALAGGKVVQELRVVIERDDRSYRLSLRDAAIHLAGAKLPPSGKAEEEHGALLERLFFYEELVMVLEALFEAFAVARTTPTWQRDIVPSLTRWLGGAA